MSWYQNFVYRKELTIDSIKVDSSLSNFNVLVKLDNTNFDFTKTRSDGYDVAFTTDNHQLCDFEVVFFDSVGQTSEYWVKIPTISASTDTVFYVYYGKADQTASLQAASSIWNNDYVLVYHMDDFVSGTTVIKDSSPNAYHGTKVAETNPEQVIGKIGKAQRFNGSTSSVSSIESIFVNNEDYTLELWCNVGATPPVHQLVCGNGQAAPNPSLYFYSNTTDGASENQTRVYVESSEKLVGTDIRSAGWTYLVLVREGTTWKLYENDLFVDDFLNDTDNIGTDFWIGRHPLISDRFFKGDVDEVRVSSVARSTEWLKTEYHNQNDALLTFGTVEEQGKIISDYISNFNIATHVFSTIQVIFSIKGLTNNVAVALYSLSAGTVLKEVVSINGINLSTDIEVAYGFIKILNRDMLVHYSLFNGIIKEIEATYTLSALKIVKKEERAVYNLLQQNVIILNPVFKLQI